MPPHGAASRKSRKSSPWFYAAPNGGDLSLMAQLSERPWRPPGGFVDEACKPATAASLAPTRPYLRRVRGGRGGWQAQTMPMPLHAGRDTLATHPWQDIVRYSAKDSRGVVWPPAPYSEPGHRTCLSPSMTSAAGL